MAKKRKHIKRRHRKHAQLFPTKLKKQTVYAIGAVWMWLFAILITLSFFGTSSLLSRVHDELFGYIGFLYFMLPPFLVLLSFQFFKMKSSIGQPNVPLGFAILIVSLTILFQQGILGESVSKYLSDWLGGSVLIVILMGLLLIGTIIMFNASLDNFINKFISLFSGLGISSKDQSSVKVKDKAALLKDTTPLKIKGSVLDDKISKSGSDKALIVNHAKNEIKDLKPEDSAKQLTIKTPQLGTDIGGIWEYPPLSILSDGPGQKADRGDVHKNANTIEQTLGSFGITAKVTEVNTGPAVTQYALQLAMGTKVSKITGLSSDLALALAAPTGQVRIEAPIPGRNLVGVEIPNRGLEFVTLKRMLQSDQLKKAKSKLSVALGLDVSGSPLIADIGKMPHVLVAGTTGSGKSVLINAFICSLLFRATPQEVRLIMVDPKRVELTGYNGIPHLLTPVIVEVDKILSALRWATNEMDNRYKQFAEVNVRNIDAFNELSGFQAMPYIVIFIDELADLMAYAPVEVEDSICRLAQMARATGIHLVVATQRPSTDVITGLIKANIPARIAFNVSSMVDSRVIIDMPGAEKLLGRGDMLYIPPDQSKPSRIQGTYVSDHEVRKVVDFMKDKNPAVEYTQEVLTQVVPAGSKKGLTSGSGSDGKDPLFDDAIRLICQHDKASASLLQRRLSVGYARAARILDQLEESGIIGPGEGSKPRDVLIKNADDYFAQAANTET